MGKEPKMSNPLISVIVPVYNVEKYLDRCVRSIMHQTYSNLEIILVDDESPDNCPAMCDNYAKEDSRIRVIHKKNGGLSDARNAGIEAANGEYIGFIDSDDYIDSDMYEFLYGIAQKENADVAMCELYHCYAGKEIFRHTADYYKVTDNIGAIHCVLESKITSVTAVNKLYLKGLFDGLRFRKGKTAEDAFIMVDLLSRAKTVVITNAQKYYYFHREGSITTKPFNVRDLDVIEAYEYNAKRALEISPDLADVVLLRRCWARFYILDKMMLSDGNYDRSIEKEYINFLKDNKRFILKCGVFTKGRRLTFLILLFSTSLYGKVVRYNSNRNKAVYE